MTEFQPKRGVGIHRASGQLTLGSVPFHLVTLVRIGYLGQTPTVIRRAE